MVSDWTRGTSDTIVPCWARFRVMVRLEWWLHAVCSYFCRLKPTLHCVDWWETTEGQGEETRNKNLKENLDTSVTEQNNKWCGEIWETVRQPAAKTHRWLTFILLVVITLCVHKQLQLSQVSLWTPSWETNFISLSPPAIRLQLSRPSGWGTAA